MLEFAGWTCNFVALNSLYCKTTTSLSVKSGQDDKVCNVGASWLVGRWVGIHTYIYMHTFTCIPSFIYIHIYIYTQNYTFNREGASFQFLKQQDD